MKLNFDCIRATMLSLEKLLTIQHDHRDNLYMEAVDLRTLYADLPKFSIEDIYYAVVNLAQAGYIDFNGQYADGGLLLYGEVSDINFAGHEFLGQIRDKEQWSIVKTGLSKVRDYSLSAISAIAEGITKVAIDKYIGSLS